MSKSEANQILELAKAKGALLFGEFDLSAGGTSSYYFDGRILSLDPEGGYRVAKAFLPILKECGARAVAGPTLGADPIVSAVSVVSYHGRQPHCRAHRTREGQRARRDSAPSKVRPPAWIQERRLPLWTTRALLERACSTLSTRLRLRVTGLSRC